MSDTESVVYGVAERYATALFELASEAGELDAVAADLDRFEALLAESADLRLLITSLVFTSDEQVKALSAVLDQAGFVGTVANFLKLVAHNRRLFVLPAMIRDYRLRLSALRGEVTADVTTALPLTDAQLADLAATLSGIVGKTVRINARVDAELIGGLVVKVGSRMVDTSLKSKLDALKIALKEVG